MSAAFDTAGAMAGTVAAMSIIIGIDDEKWTTIAGGIMTMMKEAGAKSPL
jgi:hypothetical protein